MTNRSHFFVFSLMVVVAAMSGCGDGESYSDMQDSQGYYPYPESTAGSSRSWDRVVLAGSVLSAFQLTVDGKTYADSEDFYTQEVTRLSEKVSAAGYDGWDARFEAVLGFADLARGMMVFVAPTGKTGHSDQTSVSTDGKFKFDLPSSAVDSTYNIRAVKRVNVVLSRGGEVRKFCYNFSAVEKNVKLSSSNLPVILDTFQTQLTLYACESSNGSNGVAIPSSSQGGLGVGSGSSSSPGNTTSPAAPVVVQRISLLDSPENIVAKFGDPESVVRETHWSFYRPNYDRIWKYSRFPGNPASFSCSLYFLGQKLLAWNDCPASRIQFAEGSESASTKPTGRIYAGATQQVVLSLWGMPTLVSLSTDGREATWEYTSSVLTGGSSSCELKFTGGILSSYTGVCQLNWLAHWTF